MFDGLLSGNKAGAVAMLAMVQIRAVFLLHEYQVITVVGTHDHLGKIQQGNGAAVFLYFLVQGSQRSSTRRPSVGSSMAERGV